MTDFDDEQIAARHFDGLPARTDREREVYGALDEVVRLLRSQRTLEHHRRE
jgi:hypothetical protein